MVFSTVPVYLDPPNWNQQFQANLQAPNATTGIAANPLTPPPLPSAPSGMPGSVRPGSMSERARMAKIPQPEAGLKCPRCESSNTKFCYFNNYSLTQPRHFCKTCRRYWTRGGALRSVPVGGGCRRNKRSKSSASSSKSASSAQTNRQDGTCSTSSTATGGGSGSRNTGPSSLFAQQSQLPLMASLHGLSDYPSGSAASNLGLGFPGMQPLEPAAEFQLGDGNGISAAGMGLEHWRMPQIQQFPFFGRVQGLHHQFEDQGAFSAAGPPKETSPALMPSVKTENAAHSQGVDSSREFLGVSNIEQYWGSNAGAGDGGANSAGGSCAGWATGLTGFSATSSSNIL